MMKLLQRIDPKIVNDLYLIIRKCSALKDLISTIKDDKCKLDKKCDIDLEKVQDELEKSESRRLEQLNLIRGIYKWDEETLKKVMIMEDARVLIISET